MVSMFNRKYFFLGAIEGAKKHGKGKIIFEDNCQKEVEYINDKIAFNHLGEVFDFVSNFDSLNHEEFISGNNINMVRFMKEVVSFKGHMIEGTTQDKCEV